MSYLNFNPLWILHSLFVRIFCGKGIQYKIKCPHCGEMAHYSTESEKYYCQYCNKYVEKGNRETI